MGTSQPVTTSFLSPVHTPAPLQPKSVIRSTVVLIILFQSILVLSAILSASCPHRCLDVARYAFGIDENNLLETNTNLT